MEEDREQWKGGMETGRGGRWREWNEEGQKPYQRT